MTLLALGSLLLCFPSSVLPVQERFGVQDSCLRRAAESRAEQTPGFMPEGSPVLPRRLALATTDLAPGPCTPGETNLCTQGDRFRVDVLYALPGEDAMSPGHAAPLAANSGTFWFFSPDNSEILVKVLDGCGVNGHYWVFWAATTNLKLVVEVSDLWTSRGVIYTNPPNHAALPVQDTSAFLCN